jgi:hypothetical protein
MAELLKPIESNSIVYDEEIVRSDFKTISGVDLSFILAPETGTTYSHLWRGPIFSMPTTTKEKDMYTTSFSDGGYGGTALEYLVTNVGDNVIIGNIGKDVFDMAIDGKAFSLTIPLDSSYTGVTSGLSTTTLYSAYMKTPLYDKKSTSGPCACSVMDDLISEQSSLVTTEIDQGLPNQPGINPESNSYYSSGLVYLFSDDIQRPNLSASTATTINSWSTGFNNDCPYTLGRKFPFNFRTNDVEGTYMDVPVGAIDLDGGIVTIFNKDLVEAFDFTSSTGGTSTSGATFPVSAASSTFKSVDVDQSLNMTLVLSKNEFTTSNNPTYNPLTCDGTIYVNYINLYNSSGELVAVGVLDEPVRKEKSQVVVFQTKIGL